MRNVLLTYLALGWSIAATAGCPVELVSTPTGAAQALMISKLTPLMACQVGDPLSDKSPCNVFVGKGLDEVYSISDFKTADGYLAANRIADSIAIDARWVKLGKVFDEGNNLCAQALANNAYPVIAVEKAAGNGHVALVIPGEPAKSSSWGMFVANSASFFIDNPTKGYVSAPLSKAFSAQNAQAAVFFYRKPSGSL
ncbi:hypothetical protein [Burkholderia vietnamiensis]|uniref:hypothetical protein n=1 Tax=Burkholderia vietnamiensis TaxID=60552 RepID=UPI0012DB374E|nr:hypothetical protein [Burkholderia vietnamiensis]